MQNHALAHAQHIFELLGYHLDDLAAFSPRQPKPCLRQQGLGALSIMDGKFGLYEKVVRLKEIMDGD
jgi:hypothetical protein